MPADKREFAPTDDVFAALESVVADREDDMGGHPSFSYWSGTGYTISNEQNPGGDLGPDDANRL